MRTAMKITARQWEALLSAKLQDGLYEQIGRGTWEALLKKGLIVGNRNRGWSLTPAGAHIVEQKKERWE